MERLLKTYQFSLAGKEYETRVFEDEESIKVRVFLEGEPANQLTYAVTWETRSDLATYQNLEAIDALVKIAENDMRKQVHLSSAQGDQL